MIQSRENLVTEGQTDAQRDESDFKGRCPTNVERPINRFWPTNLRYGGWSIW